MSIHTLSISRHLLSLFLLTLSISSLPPQAVSQLIPSTPLQFPHLPGTTPFNPVSRQTLNCSADPNPCDIFPCCPTGCCSPPFRSCAANGGFCTTDDGRIQCLNSNDGSTFLGFPCDSTPSSCCGLLPRYRNCTLFEGVTVCANGRGLIPCGDPAMPGRFCTLSSCCQAPFRCCTEQGEQRCCNDGTGQVLPVIVVPTPIPAVEASFEPPELAEETATPEMGSEMETPESSAAEAQGDEDEDDGSVCFPGSARVEVRGVGMRSMEELRTGDWVRVGEGEGRFSPVFMWTHRDFGYRGGRFVRVELDGGASLTATVGHMVYVLECVECERVVVDIERVEVGQLMWVVGEGLKVVVDVSRGRGKGLFNPQTVDGDIVVDGVVVTCYTKYVPMAIGHAALAPLRAISHSVTLFSWGTIPKRTMVQYERVKV